MFLILQDFAALDTLLDDCSSSPEPADYPMDEAEPSEDEDNVDDPNAFNLNQDEPVDIKPPLAKIENLVETQRFISLIANATFEEEEKQWSESEYENFVNLNPLDPKFNPDNPQFHLSLQIYLSLSQKSLQALYEAVHHSIKECYPDSTMLSFHMLGQLVENKQTRTCIPFT